MLGCRVFRSSSVLSVIAFATLFTGPAFAAETIIPLSGTVPAGGPDHFFVPFDVPTGTLEIEVRHSADASSDVLDWGLLSPTGARGWGGGNSEPAIVNADAASRSYLAGPIGVGEWRVVVGKAKIVTDPSTYQLEVVLRDEITLAPQPERAPYQSATLTAETRWYAGDFHVHSRESGDARPDLDEVATFAEMRGLDFVEITDHNVDSTLDFLVDAQSRHPDLLLMPGVEFTTYAGHANGIGATEWVDHKIGQPGVTIHDAAQQFADQGAIFSINHPALDLGDLCIGCFWDHDLDPGLVGAVEIATGGLEPFGDTFSDEAIAFWDDLCDLGFHVVPIGGSDDHNAGVDLNPFQSPIGDATTMVEAESLSRESLLAGIREGRTVVKLQGPGDAMVIIDTDMRSGDSVTAHDPNITVEVTGAAAGDHVRIIEDGVSVATFPLENANESVTYAMTTTPDVESRVRAELWVGGARRVVTAHLWVTGEEPGSSGETGDPCSDSCAGCSVLPGRPAPRCSPGLCSCVSSAAPGGTGAVNLLWLMLVVPLARRRRTARPVVA